MITSDREPSLALNAVAFCAMLGLLLEQPDATRLNLTWNEAGARVTIRYPDATTNTISVVAEKPKTETVR